MWSSGSMMYILVLAILVVALLQTWDERKHMASG